MNIKYISVEVKIHKNGVYEELHRQLCYCCGFDCQITASAVISQFPKESL